MSKAQWPAIKKGTRIGHSTGRNTKGSEMGDCRKTDAKDNVTEVLREKCSHNGCWVLNLI